MAIDLDQAVTHDAVELAHHVLQVVDDAGSSSNASPATPTITAPATFSVLPTPTDSLSQSGSWITWPYFWFAIAVLFVIFNIKSIPFMWHLRILNSFRFVLHSQRPSVSLGPGHIFQPLITTSRTQLMEMDFNIHKSNSSYFADADIARSHLVCTLFAQGIERMRGGAGAWTGSGAPMFGLALAAVSCTFRHELKPYHRYEMWTRVLSWDEKWIYIVTHFVRPGTAKPRTYSLYPQQQQQRQRRDFVRRAIDKREEEEEEDGESVKSLASSLADSESDDEPVGFDPTRHIYATALSKCVFKSGRKTIAPNLMLRLSGLLPVADGAGAEDPKNGLIEAMVRKVEIERQRGMESAKFLATQTQKNLEGEICICDALGTHIDGAGLAAIIGFFMHFIGIRKEPVL